MDNDKVYCTFCGEEYSAELSRCPECGEKNKNVMKKSDEVEDTFVPTAVYDDTDEDDEDEYDDEPRGGTDKIPIWLKTLILVIAGIAIIVAALFMLYKMGMINFGKSGDTEPSASVSLPVESTNPMETTSPVVQVSPSMNITDPTETTPSPAVESVPPAETSPAVSDLPTAEPTPAVSEVVEPSPAVECTSITINRTDITFFGRGEVCNFNVMTEPSSAADFVEWESSDPKVVKVDAMGSATAVNGGTAYVTATCGDQTASCIVRCNFEAGEYMTMSNEDITMTAAGETSTLSVQDLTSAEAANLKWSSSDEKVATVNESGVVTAVSKGTATITANLDGTLAECVVRVNIPSITTEDGSEVAVTLNHTDVTLFTVGEQVALKVEAGDSSAIDTTSLTWKTSNEAVATVDSTGLVKAAGAGTATVSTVVGGETVSCIVRVSLQ